MYYNTLTDDKIVATSCSIMHKSVLPYKNKVMQGGLKVEKEANPDEAAYFLADYPEQLGLCGVVENFIQIIGPTKFEVVKPVILKFRRAVGRKG